MAEDRALAAATVRYHKRKPTRRMAPFTEEWLYRLHGNIFGKVWSYAGKPRTGSASYGVPVHQIGPHMRDLAEDIALWDGNAVEDAAQLHLRAVRIHPFTDGNGRWARLLASIWVHQRSGRRLMWPEAVRQDRSKFRNAYICALEEALKGDEITFIGLHRRLLE